MKRILNIAVFLIGMLAISSLAQAHYLWIETTSQESKGAPAKLEVFYGEFEEFLREKAGGRLDEVGKIEAWTLTPQGKNEIRFEKKDDHFEVDIPAKQPLGYSTVQIQELGRPVQDWSKYDIGVVKPNFYATTIYPTASNLETDLAIPEVKTTLAIYPLRLGDEIAVKVFFKNEALPNAKLNVHAPNGWSKEIKTDETGMIRFRPPWQGQYVFEVIHLEKVPGEFQGVSYEAIRHRATFTWNVAKASA